MTSIAVDAEQDNVYVVSEKPTADPGVDVEIIRISKEGGDEVS